MCQTGTDVCRYKQSFCKEAAHSSETTYPSDTKHSSIITHTHTIIGNCSVAPTSRKLTTQMVLSPMTKTPRDTDGNTLQSGATLLIY